jgi:hypothetical protein
MTTAAISALATATDYVRRGWAPIPIPLGSKAPRAKGWQDLRLTEGDLPDHFRGAHNVGVLLGEPSGGLVDLDLDCAEALKLGPALLPPTNSIFGRAGKPRSHRLYFVPSACGRVHKFVAPGGETLLEYRATGGQTVFPGSVHPSGEPIEWESDGDPQTVDAGDLRKAAGELASACLLLRHYPAEGSRQDFAMAIAGGLLRCRWTVEKTEAAIEALARAAADEALRQRVGAVKQTAIKLQRGDPVRGWPTLAKLIGDGTARAVRAPFDVETKASEDRLEPSESRLVSVRLADVQPEPVRWLWHCRFPLGKLSVLAGIQGVGKSFLTLDMIARVTTGRPWPDDRDGSNPVGSAIILSAEDALNDTIRPRLDAHGADVSRVNAIEAVEEVDHSGRRSFDLVRDILLLDELLAAVGDVRLVVIDPLDAYLGTSIDSHKNPDIRRVLQPLAKVAEKYGAAVLGVAHLNKTPNLAAMFRVLGSIAYTAAPRSAWLVCRDRDEPARRLLLNLKLNVALAAPGLAFTLENGTVHWLDDTVDVTADEALGDVDSEHTETGTKLAEAVEFLRECLKEGGQRSTDILKWAKENGIAERTLKRAKAKLRIRADRSTGTPKVVWFWQLPQEGQCGTHDTDGTLGTLQECQEGQEGQECQQS